VPAHALFENILELQRISGYDGVGSV